MLKYYVYGRNKHVLRRAKSSQQTGGGFYFSHIEKINRGTIIICSRT